MPDYNHPRWPSPRARLVAIKLGLDVITRYPLNRMKRLTHEQALELLAKKAKKTVPEFLALSMDDSFRAIGSVRVSPFSREPIPVNPLYSANWYY